MASHPKPNDDHPDAGSGAAPQPDGGLAAELRLEQELDNALDRFEAEVDQAVDRFLAPLARAADRAAELGRPEWLQAAIEVAVGSVLHRLPEMPTDVEEHAACATGVLMLRNAIDFRFARAAPDPYYFQGKLAPFVVRARQRVVELYNLANAASRRVTDFQIAFLRQVDASQPRYTDFSQLPFVLLAAFLTEPPPGGWPAKTLSESEAIDIIDRLLRAWARRGRTPKGTEGKYEIANQFFAGFGVGAESARALEHTWQTRDRAAEKPKRTLRAVRSAKKRKG
jgi:hypothetical protein